MRVYLNYIVISNFKSFRGEITLGPIRSFTAIMGPNGAGKSNVMDAISFVLGERISNMRVKRLNELIYGASLGKPIAESARVTAVFVLEDGINKSFTRIIRNAASEYKIDDEVVTAKVYLSQLDQLDLNVRNKNFLVFQGTVESIAIKTPKERTEMLEEISGSSDLKEEYDRLKGEMCKAEIEVQYINQKKKDLWLQKKYALMEEQEAQKYQMLEKEYIKKKTELQLFELYHIKMDIEDLEAVATEKEQILPIYKSDQKNALKELQYKRSQLELLSYEVLKTEQDLVKQEITFKNKQAAFVVVKEQVSHWQGKLDKANLSLAEAYTAYNAQKQCIQDLENELIQIKDIRKIFEAALSSQESSLELSNTQVERYFDLKKIAQQQCSEHIQLIRSLKQKQNLIQNKLDNENRKKVDLDSIQKRKAMTLDDTRKRLKKLEVYIKETENTLVDKTQAKTNLLKEVKDNDGKSYMLQKELKAISEQLEDIKLDNHFALQLKEQAQTVKLLKEFYPEVALLLEETKKVLTVSQRQSETNTINIEIHALEERLKYAKYDVKEAQTQKAALEEELNIIQQKIRLVCDIIASLNADLSARNTEIQNIELLVNSVENNIFANFCEETGVTSVQDYERGSLRIYQEQMRKRQDYDEQYNRIQNMLDFERGRNTENAIVKWKNAVKNAQDKLEEAHEMENGDKLEMEVQETKLHDLQCTHNAKKLELSVMEESLGKCRQEVRRIAKLIKEAERELAIQITKQEKKKAEWHAILKSCKIEGIVLPMENIRTTSTNTLNSSSFSTDELYEQEMRLQINFSCIPQNIRVRQCEHIQNVREQFTKEIIGIQTMLQQVQKPNLKSDERVHVTILELNETKKDFKEARETANDIKKKFEAVMQERRDRFLKCFDHIVSQLDFIYKCLTNDQSAQAVLVPENPEEPYLNGINYSCIAPGKRHLSLSNFSGGEKTLAALALLFAIHSYRPAPFFILDEIDAALDGRNIRNVVRFIQSKTDVMQFIIISLKPELFSRADALVGVCSDLESEFPESLLFTLDLSQYVIPHKKSSK
ncbi:hypothetical protein KM043_002199 [Ampulex compressa]|nr:hypothetical protein KM043_002199 [Ampulex compressa]